MGETVKLMHPEQYAAGRSTQDPVPPNASPRDTYMLYRGMWLPILRRVKNDREASDRSPLSVDQYLDPSA